MVMLAILLERGMFYEQLMYWHDHWWNNFYVEYSCSKKEGDYEFCVKWAGGQKVGHETQMLLLLDIDYSHTSFNYIFDDMM